MQKAPQKAPSTWRRVAPGRYGSSDERFEVDSEGSGRWFLRDQQERDELRLPRTTGPHATLDAAKEAAERQREIGPAKSPLAARLAGGGRQENRAGGPNGRKVARCAPAKASSAQRWLDRLADKDPPAARRARALIGALDRIGVPDAETVVRRDLEGLRPAVAEAVLAVAIGRELARTGDPARLLAAVLDVVSMKGGLADDDRLPGWRLVEDGERGRRMHVTSADVLGGAPSRRAPRTRSHT